jgi:hypothetical protein
MTTDDAVNALFETVTGVVPLAVNVPDAGK